MKTTGSIQYTDYENFYPGRETGERSHRARAFWSEMSNQRMTQNYRVEISLTESGNAGKRKPRGRKQKPV